MLQASSRKLDALAALSHLDDSGPEVGMNGCLPAQEHVTQHKTQENERAAHVHRISHETKKKLESA